MKTMIVMLAAVLLCSFANDTAQAGNLPFGGTQAVVPSSPAVARALVVDFNLDGYPDFVLQNASTHQTAIWYLYNNVRIGGVYGPTLPVGWGLKDVADLDGYISPDYVLFNPNTRQTAIWYLDYSGDNWYLPQPTFIGGAYGPTLPRGWELVASGGNDLNGLTDYFLCNLGTRQTAVWYLNNNVFVGGAYGSTLQAGWGVAGMQIFYGRGDCVLFNPSTGQTQIAYLDGTRLIGSTNGPTVPRGWALVARADFNHDYYPDYLLYNASTRQTAIWYLNYDNTLIGGAYGPTIPVGWSLVAP